MSWCDKSKEPWYVANGTVWLCGAMCSFSSHVQACQLPPQLEALSLFLCPLCFYNPLSPRRLRALSGGGGSGSSGGGSSCAVASPPLSPALPKYKLADYRYGREEMLALYVKDNKVGRSKCECRLVTVLQSLWLVESLFSDPPTPPLSPADPYRPTR